MHPARSLQPWCHTLQHRGTSRRQSTASAASSLLPFPGTGAARPALGVLMMRDGGGGEVSRAHQHGNLWGVSPLRAPDRCPTHTHTTVRFFFSFWITWCRSKDKRDYAKKLEDVGGKKGKKKRQPLRGTGFVCLSCKSAEEFP